MTWGQGWWPGNAFDSTWRSAAYHHSGSYRLQRTAKATEQPITFEIACDHLRLGDPTSAEAVAQQALVERMIAAAVGETERYCDIALLTQQWKLTTQFLRLPYPLPKAPLQSIEAITSAGVVVDPATYRVEIDERLPGGLLGVADYFFGTTVPGTVGVEIDFTAGWATPDDVPGELVQAMLLMVGTWFMHRESAQPFKLELIPGVGATDLLDPFRLEVFG
jgi:uncharacterized phiE125 gp8 family phage protein